ncbi:hypothetical protein IJT93_10375 [bacterium]|nr:hypothetical protein [bacterium]
MYSIDGNALRKWINENLTDVKEYTDDQGNIWYWAKCPVHGGSRSSFKVSLSSGWCQCQACGVNGRLWKVLQDNHCSLPEPPHEDKGLRYYPPDQTAPKTPPPETEPKIAKSFYCGGGYGMPTAEYKYKDELGKVLYVVTRHEKIGENGKKQKQFRQWAVIPDKPGQYYVGLKGVRRILYNLDLLAAPRPKTQPLRDVLICEGEKDCNTALKFGHVAVTNNNGSSGWKEAFSNCVDSLRGKDCYIIPDNDEPGEKHAREIHSFLTEAGIKAYILRLPDLPPKGDLTDWVESGHTLNEFLTLKKAAHEAQDDRQLGLLEAAEPAPVPKKEIISNSAGKTAKASASAEPPRADAEERPQVIFNVDPHAALEETLELFVKLNDPPLIFNVMGAMNRLSLQTRSLSEINLDSLRAELISKMDFIFIRKDGSEHKKFVPKDLASAFLGLPASRWHLPELTQITTAPIFSSGGDIRMQKGYDPETKVYYIPEIEAELNPPSPVSAYVENAVRNLNEVLFDFPFTDEASRAHAIGAMLQPLVRQMYSGPSPMFLIIAPTAGTGKSLLAKVILMSSLGLENPGAIIPPAAGSFNSEAWNKVLFASLLSCPQYIFIDNIVGTLDNEALSNCLTSVTVRNRILGQSKEADGKNYALWIGTGNNLKLSPDTMRRVALIELDAKTENPAERARSNFKHPNIQQYVLKNWKVIFEALTVLVLNWIEKGRPTVEEAWCWEGPPPAPQGSYEGWYDVIGGILCAAKIPGFLCNRKQAKAYVADKEDEWQEFLLFWRESKKLPYRNVYAKALFSFAEENGLLLTQISGTSEKSRLASFSRKLRTLNRAPHGGLQIVHMGKDRAGTSLYSLSKPGMSPADINAVADEEDLFRDTFSTGSLFE